MSGVHALPRTQNSGPTNHTGTSLTVSQNSYKLMMSDIFHRDRNLANTNMWATPASSERIPSGAGKHDPEGKALERQTWGPQFGSPEPT